MNDEITLKPDITWDSAVNSFTTKNSDILNDISAGKLSINDNVVSDTITKFDNDIFTRTKDKIVSDTITKLDDIITQISDTTVK